MDTKKIEEIIRNFRSRQIAMPNEGNRATRPKDQSANPEGQAGQPAVERENGNNTTKDEPE